MEKEEQLQQNPPQKTTLSKVSVGISVGIVLRKSWKNVTLSYNLSIEHKKTKKISKWKPGRIDTSNFTSQSKCFHYGTVVESMFSIFPLSSSLGEGGRGRG